MTEHEFLSKVSARLPLRAPGEAEPIARAVLCVLGERLSRQDAEGILAAELPSGLGDALTSAAPHGEAFDARELHRRVGSRLSVRSGIAAEETLVVLESVAESVREEVLVRIRRELSPDLASLVMPPVHDAVLAVHLHPERRTLAEGEPGGSRPLHSARPGRTQSHSVAAEDNPHAETKLSTARGLTQEREDETLATGVSGSHTPLNEKGR